MGMVRVNVPAVTVCDPKVCTLTALLLWLELYRSTASNAVASVTPLKTMLALGVINAVVLVDDGAVPNVTATPPAVYPVPLTSPVEL